MFCLLCNSEEKLYDGLCKSCYLKEFELVEVPEYATFTVCSHCGATLKHDKWIESAYYDDEIINDAIQKDIKINENLKNVEITTEILTNRGTMYDCIIHANGQVLNEYIDNDYPIEVKVVKGVCPDCSKFHSGYYEAVIQLRADDRKLEEDEIQKADEFISNEIQRLCKTNKLAYVTERIVLKEGVDYQVGSHNAAHKIAENLQKQFGGIITESRRERTSPPLQKLIVKRLSQLQSPQPRVAGALKNKLTPPERAGQSNKTAFSGAVFLLFVNFPTPK